MREGSIVRCTAETEIRLKLNLDGKGKAQISSGSGFLDHMLILWAKHGSFDLELECRGDYHVDAHHSVEDIGICLGSAFAKALSDFRGVRRYAHIILPMDEALLLCAVDLSGRSFLDCRLDIPTEKIGDFDTELVREFLLAFVRKAAVTLHIRQLAGENSHHIVEACFKALGRTLAAAVAIDPEKAEEIPSTKGVLI
ncbi:MAG: imidazoleglycerol-phosphate dehydratase HisB [Bacillota bacterium]|nr:imidazoleglycerol-phosphate dehydratase HisB [Bacillota bacterium]